MSGNLRIRPGLFIRLGLLAVTVCLVVTIAAAAGDAHSTPQEVFDAMRGSFQSAKAKGVHAKYQWDLSGPNGGQWWIDVEDGKYKMGKGKIDNPTVTFVTSDKDWVAISGGQLSGTWAYITGRFKVRGDQGVARKLGEMFP